MNKRSTTLLTVIAVATLLITLLGSTFAFFAIQANNTAEIKIDTTTAKGTDIFNATGSATLKLDVTNGVMRETAIKDEEGNNTKNIVAVDDTDSSMKVSLTAGSGKATCTYKLIYESTGMDYIMTEGAANEKEYTLEGSYGADGFLETNMDKVAELLASKTFTIENDEDTATTEQIWTFTARFYNLAINQAIQMDKSYAGNIRVTDVNCVNSASLNE